MMRVYQAVSAWIVAAILLSIGVAAPTASGQTTTYEYTGHTFTFCGYGCPGEPPENQPENAPATRMT